MPGRHRLPAAASFTVARLPGIRFGAGVIDQLPQVVAGRGRRLFLVTGERSFAEERLARLVGGLADLDVTLAGHVRTAAEPGPELVDGHVAAARDLAVDVVVGIGGGSVLDTAKAVAGLARTGTSVMDHVEGVGRGLPYAGPSIPFVAVPTTAGTGSEVTRNAVITRRGPEGFKRSFRDDRLIATDALVDPDLLDGSSAALIAANGLDALTQLLEAWTSTAASAMTDALALDGLASVRAGLLTWHADPSGPDAGPARRDMAWAALLSGICLANAGLGAVHGLAAPIGALLPIAHGAACGAILAATVRANILAMEQRDPGAVGLTRYAIAGRVLAGLDDDTTDTAARTALVELLGAWSTSAGSTPTRDAGLPQVGCVQRARGRERELDAQQSSDAHGRGAGGHPARARVGDLRLALDDARDDRRHVAGPVLEDEPPAVAVAGLQTRRGVAGPDRQGRAIESPHPAGTGAVSGTRLALALECAAEAAATTALALASRSDARCLPVCVLLVPSFGLRKSPRGLRPSCRTTPEVRVGPRLPTRSRAVMRQR